MTRRGAIAALALLLACAGAALSKGAVRADSATHATFIFGGDVLIHTPLWNQAQRTARANGTRGGYDFRPMFDDIRSLVSRADLAVCHLETPIVPRGEALSTFPLFGVPREIIPAMTSCWIGCGLPLPSDQRLSSIESSTSSTPLATNCQ